MMCTQILWEIVAYQYLIKRFILMLLYLDIPVMFSIFVNEDGGAVYIRWWRKSCPKGAELVYIGIKYMIWYVVFIIKVKHTHTCIVGVI